MRHLGVILDDVMDKPKLLKEINAFFKDRTRELKLVLFNKNVDDSNVATFIKANEDILSAIGSQVTRDFTVPVYFYIGPNRISNYTMWYAGSIEQGLIHFELLLNTQDERNKHVR